VAIYAAAYNLKMADFLSTVSPAVIDQEAVQKLLQAGATLVEVLSPQAYDRIHLAGAINIPLEQIDATALQRLPSDRPVIVYCFDYQ